MATVASRPTPAADDRFGRPFAAVICDWDGTVVPDRRASAATPRRRLQQLMALGVEVVIVSGTHLDNVQGQLRARPVGPGRLHLCLNRGAEVWRLDECGAVLVGRRVATNEEDRALDAAAKSLVARFAERGLDAEMVSSRLNRRKVDLLPTKEWADPPKAKIDATLSAVTHLLRSAGFQNLAEVASLAERSAHEAGLVDARITSDAKHVEIGLCDKSDSSAWAFSYLADRGIGPGLVLVAGDEFGPLGGVRGSDDLLRIADSERCTAASYGVEPSGVPTGVVHRPGGPTRFMADLGALAGLIRVGVPAIDEDPGWVVDLPDANAPGAALALGTLADGVVGSRAVLEEADAAAGAVLVAGVWSGSGPAEHLLLGPVWTSVQTGAVDAGQRRLDLRTGMLVRRAAQTGGGELRTARFALADQEGVMALVVQAPGPLPGPGLQPGQGRDGRLVWASAQAERGGVTAFAADRRRRGAAATTLERRVLFRHGLVKPPHPGRLRAELASLCAVPMPVLAVRQRAAWAQRWRDADIEIPDDQELQLAARFALFHLLSSVQNHGESGVGARGLSGPAYGGHVFWDADVFVLPALAATRPAAARAMLEYRIRRLPAALAAARAAGQRGARFPWESGRDGNDVTPRVGYLGDRPVPILSGDLEVHIVADIAWAACCYADWSGDEAFLRGPGRPLLVETARYWCSRAVWDSGGRAHVNGVMGPDEYHGPVDDNAFTNGMARWNLCRAADLVQRSSSPDDDALTEELQSWRALASALVDGWDPVTKRHEQFAGYDALEPVLVSALGQPPFAADLLLGPDRVSQTQVVKQPDVLMLHHLLGHTLPAGSLEADVQHYVPRTCHGSSLSAPAQALVLARAGRSDDAVEAMRIAARTDLADLTGQTGTGLHLASLGGLWQALVRGLAGLTPEQDALVVDPYLPSGWSRLSVAVQFHGVPVRIRVTPDAVMVQTDRPVSVRFRDGPAQTVVGSRSLDLAAGPD